MNTRDYKPFVEGEYYHVYNRGNDCQELFLEKEDYIFFLYRLKETLYPPDSSPFLEETQTAKTTYPRRKPLPPESFTLLSYCLMPNHFHFLIQQNTDIEISKLISKTCISYSKYFNKKYKRTGSLFQAKFRAINITNTEYFLWLSAYIHTNPSVAGLIDNDKEYLWSSYQDYLGKRNGTLCNKNKILEMFKNSTTLYEEYVTSCRPHIADRKYLQKFRLDDNEL